MNVGVEPTELDMFHLDNVLVTDLADKGRQKYRAFLIRILSDNVEYIDNKKLVKFLLVDNDYLGRGDRHCMAILEKMYVDHNTEIYYCKNSTMEGDAKRYEKIEVRRRDIDLHELNVKPDGSHEYKRVMKEPKCSINPSYGTYENPTFNVRQVKLPNNAKFAALNSNDIDSSSD